MTPIQLLVHQDQYSGDTTVLEADSEEGRELMGLCGTDWANWPDGYDPSTGPNGFLIVTVTEDRETRKLTNGSLRQVTNEEFTKIQKFGQLWDLV